MEQQVTTEVGRIQAAYARRDAGPRKDRQNRGRLHMMKERDLKMAQLLRRDLAAPLAATEVLDVGCGDGHQLAWLHAAGAQASNLNGVDLLVDKVERARQTYPEFNLLGLNAEVLPFADRSFDLLLSMTVFSSILDPTMAHRVAGEMTRVLRPGGLILWYDMRYPNPANSSIRAMTRQRIRELFPAFTVKLESTTLIPQLARALGFLDDSALTQVYGALTSLRFLRSHLVGTLRLRG